MSIILIFLITWKTQKLYQCKFYSYWLSKSSIYLTCKGIRVNIQIPNKLQISFQTRYPLALASKKWVVRWSTAKIMLNTATVRLNRLWIAVANDWHKVTMGRVMMSGVTMGCRHLNIPSSTAVKPCTYLDNFVTLLVNLLAFITLIFIPIFR